MATRAVLTPYSAEFPATDFPQLMLSNRRPVLSFDPTTDQTCFWTFVAAQGLSGALTLVVTFAMATATSGTVGLQVSIEALSDGDTVDTDATSSFDAPNDSSAITVPATAGYVAQAAIPLTLTDAIAAGDYCRLGLNRDADSSVVTDDASGFLYLIAAELRDTA